MPISALKCVLPANLCKSNIEQIKSKQKLKLSCVDFYCHSPTQPNSIKVRVKKLLVWGPARMAHNFKNVKYEKNAHSMSVVGHIFVENTRRFTYKSRHGILFISYTSKFFKFCITQPFFCMFVCKMPGHFKIVHQIWKIYTSIACTLAHYSMSENILDVFVSFS